MSGHSAAATGKPLALAALFAGATAIATSALFVKVSEAGPVATAFWRVFLALPFLWAWAMVDDRRAHFAALARDHRLLAAAGLFFAGDLAVWHWSIVLTSVANATLLSNLAPIFVTLVAWLLFGARPRGIFVVGLSAALAGVVMLIGVDFGKPGHVAGNALGVLTAVFYAGYQLTVTRLRAAASTASVMAWSGVVMSAVLLPLALLANEPFFPATQTGWIKLFGLALISQVAGQSLIAYAMAHLPATFSSVGLLLQPVMAALFAWLLLGETMGTTQIIGGIVVLVGIRIAHHARY
ncbi:MAG: DMT family transporter [Burkholderiales bacterium]